MKITIINILVSLLPMIIINIIGIGLIYYMFNDVELIIIIAISFFFFFSMLPTIYLLFNYLKKNKRMTVSLDGDKILIFSKKAKNVIYIENINDITFNGSKNIFEEHNIRFSTFDDFYYVDINIKDGSKVVLTSLLSMDLRKILLKNYPNIKIKYNYRLFPYVN